MNTKPIESRFWSKVKKANEDKCWEWIGAKNRKDYGYFRKDNKWARAHRISWELHNGKIPDNLCVLHKCDNPPCVNPNHLFLGTMKDDMQDCKNKGRLSNQKGSKNSNSKLTEQQVKEIRELYKTGNYIQKEIAKKYNTDRGNISHIINSKTWKSIILFFPIIFYTGCAIGVATLDPCGVKGIAFGRAQLHVECRGEEEAFRAYSETEKEEGASEKSCETEACVHIGGGRASLGLWAVLGDAVSAAAGFFAAYFGLGAL